MDTSELLRRAWEAVEASGVPEPLQQAAFLAAVEDLRAQEDEGGALSSSAGPRSPWDSSPKKKPSTKPRPKSTSTAAPENGEAPQVDDDTFFSILEHQSGISEQDLRDVLSLSGDKVHVTQPQRKLGTSKAQQAKTIISLVAPARAFGLGERPISAAAVRDEVKRLHAYDESNYSSSHLRELGGVNKGGSPAELVLTSRWPDEFASAVNQALGRRTDES